MNPLKSIDLHIEILDLLHADAHGETYRVLVGYDKFPEELKENKKKKHSKKKKSKEPEPLLPDRNGKLIDWKEETYTLKVLLHSKFNKMERAHILK